jgi:hypothetical protein
MEIVKLKSRTDSTGQLHLAVGIPNSEVEVTVVVAQSRREMMTDEELKRDWEEFVHRTAGSIKDPKFKRYPQGSFPVREPLK